MIIRANPTADWALQQLREVVGNEGGHRYLIHDRDRIFAKRLDHSIRTLSVEVLRSPVSSPKANAICERVIGTAARMLRLADSDVGGASTVDSQVLGDTLQLRTSTQRAGTRCAGSAGEARRGPEAKPQPRLGGERDRPREIDPRRPASRILGCRDADERLNGQQECPSHPVLNICGRHPAVPCTRRWPYYNPQTRSWVTTRLRHTIDRMPGLH
jgi:hypothetical protein